MMRVQVYIVLLAAAALSWQGFGQEPAAPPPAEAAPAPPPGEAAPPPPEAAPAPPPAESPPAPPPAPDLTQVQIEVWISQTNEDGLRDIGANLNYERFIRGVEQTGSVERVRTDVLGLDPFQVTIPAPDMNPDPVDNVRLSPEAQNPWRPQGNTLVPDAIHPGVSTMGGAGLTFEVIDAGRGTIEGIVRGSETRADVDLISKPEMLVVNGGVAKLHAGEEVPYQQVAYNKAGLPALNVSWREVGVTMELTPLVLPNNLIQLNIAKLEISDLIGEKEIGGFNHPVFSTRQQSGSVIVPNEQTLVIGGLSTRSTTKREDRIPIIGRLPLLGIPFRGRSTNTSTTHLLIFVSPTVVDLRSLHPKAEEALQFWRKEKWKNADRIEEEISLMDVGL
jgi:type II secretory pathway component GspD/PulD (secretin)